MSRQEEILRVLAPGLRAILKPLSPQWEGVEEIRLRIDQPLTLTMGGRSVFVDDSGKICAESGKENGDGKCFAGRPYRVTREEIRDTVNLLSSYSRYAFEDKIRQGFLTIQGGHRVGLAGRVILESTDSRGMVKTISPITFLNLRIARQVIGCAEPVLPFLWRTEEEGSARERNGEGTEEHSKDHSGRCQRQIHDTLLISPPGMGKTTLLRDLIRLLSYQGMTVGLVDERSELAACHQGIPQNDLGPRTDVLDGCPKAEGLMMMVRTMSPQIIAVDEVGTEEDHRALEYAMHCGSRILATVHGSSWEELLQRPVLERWLKEGRFGRYVFIERDGEDHGRRCRYWVCDSTGKTITTVESIR